MLTFVLVVLRMTLHNPPINALVFLLALNLVAETSQDLAENGDSAIGIRVEKGEVHPKVFELAGRGITVADLLTFYEKLGAESVMPHLNPCESTTQERVPSYRCLRSIFGAGRLGWPA